MAGLTYTVFDTTDLSTAEVYGRTLKELGNKHQEVVGLSADLAKSTKIGVFAEAHPDRFFNMGIAEQNLFGVAAGMAKAGLIPFVSTFAIFTSMRGLDQVHTDICYQNANVKMIATHAGVSFGQAGSTHHCTEDLSIMRAMANCTVIVPADGMETANAVVAAYEKEGPVYIRINRGFDQKVFQNADYGFEIGKGIQMTDGTDITIIGCGSTVYQAIQAASILDQVDGIKARVINMHTIKPVDKEMILKALHETRRIVTVEDHNIIGGLGSAVSEVISESGKACAFMRLGIPDEFSVIGLHEDLMAHYQIDANGIVDNVRELMGRDFEEDEDWEDEV
ncbi:transketolase family protein [Vallitalea okinawensis]|uniref:transketolase family protein n=1 Tax=Vallitalea okinawensis TaxID=2078660 RepID=UPI000CFC8ED9|nr:transketolase C-terminal domain-containing protein [Vallitalea okinawensis]